MTEDVSRLMRAPGPHSDKRTYQAVCIPFTHALQQGLPFIACKPSCAIKGIRASAARGSAQVTLQIALTARPAKAIKARYPQTADSAASARNAALAVAAESCRFCLASVGIKTAARINRPIPIGLGLASMCPSSVRTETRATNATRTKSKPPAILAARSSSWPSSDGKSKRCNTTAAERSSTALSPPKPRSAGLRAAHAAPNESARQNCKGHSNVRLPGSDNP